MHGWLGCLLLLLVTTINAARAEHELIEIRAVMRSMKFELDSIRLELDAVKIENTALSTRLRAIEPTTMADPTDATNSHDERDSNSARRLTGHDSAGGRASIHFDGNKLQITSPLHVNGSFTSAGAISGAGVTASGAVSGVSVTAPGTITGGSLTDGTATISGGVLASATSVTASGAITCGSLTDGTATISGGVLASATPVTASGAISGGTVSSTGDVNIGGDLTLSGNIFNTGAVAFSASTGSNWNSASGSTVPFSDAIINEGSGFDSSTYTFTAPVKGIYYIASHAAANLYTTQMCARVNGVKVNPCAIGSATWEGISFSWIREISAGSTVSIYSEAGYKAAQPRSSEKNAASRAGQTPCTRWAVGICYTGAKSGGNG